jgi:hypothetical protein
MVKDVASHNFPFWNCLGKRCAALPFVDVASHTALTGALHSICPGSPKTGSYDSPHPYFNHPLRLKYQNGDTMLTAMSPKAKE